MNNLLMKTENEKKKTVLSEFQTKLKEKKKYYESLYKAFENYNNNGKITVAYFCDSFYPIVDGVIGVLNNYASRLMDKCNIVVFVPKHKGKVTLKGYTIVGVTSAYFKAVNYSLAFPDFDPELEKLVKKLRIDIVHSHSPFTMGAYAVRLAKKRKVPLVSTLHSQYKKDFLQATKSEPISKILLKDIMRKFQASTEVWTMHESALNTLFEYGYNGRYLIVPNATNYVYPTNAENLIQIVNEKYNLTHCRNVFLFVGRIVEQKNILFLVRSLKILKDMGVDFKMFFVGEGPSENKLRDLIKELNMSKEIVQTGRIESIDELLGMYLRADLFLFPSLYDMSSIVQLEAAAHKTPTLFIEGSVTACGVKDGYNGYLSPNSEEAYAKKIVEIINNQTELKRISEECYKHLYIHWDSVMEQVLERYKYLIEQNKIDQEKKKEKKLQQKEHKSKGKGEKFSHKGELKK